MDKIIRFYFSINADYKFLDYFFALFNQVFSS